MKLTFLLTLALSLPGWSGPAAAQSPSTYYVCPGNVFTNTISPREAEQRGCKSREATQPTTIAGPKLKPATPVPRASDARIDQAEQKARDTDSRRILEAELLRAETELESLRREYNGGEPERRGEERNAQRYIDRVADMKAAIARKESDVAAIRREIGKLPS
jgi:hypothetical protein